jgi:dihydrofolate reductase
MLYRDSEGLKLAQEKVVYTRNGTEYEQPVIEGRNWWLDFEQKWDDMEIVRFEHIEYTEEQLTRFEEVKAMVLSQNTLNDYVMEGVAGAGLEILVLKKENEELKQLLADLTEVVLLGGAS